MDTFKGGRCNPGSSNGTDDIIGGDTTMSCELMNKALVADGAAPVSREEAMSGQPAKGHYIAIMVGAAAALSAFCDVRSSMFCIVFALYVEAVAAIVASTTCCCCCCCCYCCGMSHRLTVAAAALTAAAVLLALAAKW
jgi:hypothetical protein